MNDPLMSARARRLQQLRLRDLRLLAEIDRHGTLQGVSRALFVSQPAVSQALRSLEAAVGVPLATRSRRGVALTDAGRSLQAHLQAADASLAAGLSGLHEPVPRPVLRLGTIPYAMTAAVPAALGRLGAPGFTLRIVTGAVDALMQALVQGRVDAILTRRPPPREAPGATPSHDAAIAWTRVATLRNAVACGRDHPLARRRPTLDALAAADWVLPDEPSMVRSAFGELFARAGLPTPRPRVVSANFSDNLKIAAASRLLTVAPVDVIARAQPSMKALLAPPEWEGEIGLASLAHRADWPPLAALREALAPAPARPPARPRRAPRATPRGASLRIDLS
jgi:DNA-binding transcriptional LysR family regulator